MLTFDEKLPINRQCISEKPFQQTFYRHFKNISKRFDNVLQTSTSKCFCKLFIRPVENVVKMLCVCWVGIPWTAPKVYTFGKTGITPLRGDQLASFFFSDEQEKLLVEDMLQ